MITLNNITYIHAFLCPNGSTLLACRCIARCSKLHGFLRAGISGWSRELSVQTIDVLFCHTRKFLSLSMGTNFTQLQNFCQLSANSAIATSQSKIGQRDSKRVITYQRIIWKSPDILFNALIEQINELSSLHICIVHCSGRFAHWFLGKMRNKCQKKIIEIMLKRFLLLRTKGK